MKVYSSVCVRIFVCAGEYVGVRAHHAAPEPCNRHTPYLAASDKKGARRGEKIMLRIRPEVHMWREMLQWEYQQRAENTRVRAKEREEVVRIWRELMWGEECQVTGLSKWPTDLRRSLTWAQRTV
jgi:hypothetical protein